MGSQLFLLPGAGEPVTPLLSSAPSVVPVPEPELPELPELDEPEELVVGRVLIGSGAAVGVEGAVGSTYIETFTGVGGESRGSSAPEGPPSPIGPSPITPSSGPPSPDTGGGS